MQEALDMYKPNKLNFTRNSTILRLSTKQEYETPKAGLDSSGVRRRSFS
jgi:hypothetical protein